MDLQAIGTAIGSIVIGLGGFVAGRAKRRADTAVADAEGELYRRLREEITALHDEIIKLRRYVGRLERAIREGGLELPSLDEPAGGTD